MLTKEIGEGLVALCQQGKNNEAIQTYYSSEVVTYEADPSMPPSKGLEAVMAGAAWWEANMEVHEGKVTGPYINGDQFACGFTYDVTEKPTGKRALMDEIALYRVQDSKIVEARFFYAASMSPA